MGSLASVPKRAGPSSSSSSVPAKVEAWQPEGATQGWSPIGAAGGNAPGRQESSDSWEGPPPGEQRRQESPGGGVAAALSPRISVMNNGENAVTDEMSQRQIAYERRRAAKREAKRFRKNEIDGKKGFLSNLPEVEADVPYRFNFIVSATGDYAETIAGAACASNAAKSMPVVGVDEEDHEEGGSLRNASPGVEITDSQGVASLRRKDKRALRCLCRLVDTSEATREEKPRLAKLAFQPLSIPPHAVPLCQNRLEALNTALVFALIVDQEPAMLEAQLRQLTETVESLRARSRPKNRPVRAVLLCYTNAEERNRKDLWVEIMADYEQVHGDVWKFGPIGMWEADGLHAVFTEIAACRIPFGAGPNTADVAALDAGKRLAKFSTGDLCKDDDIEEEDEEALREAEGLPGPEMPGSLQPLSSNNMTLGRSQFGSEASGSSTTSEGWQKPPVFMAESEGSECSERAIELHKRMYALP